MNTLEQIDDFAAFAKTRLGADASANIDELYGEWRRKAFADTDAKAVMASVRDIESGERGESLDSFLADFDKQRKAKK